MFVTPPGRQISKRAVADAAYRDPNATGLDDRLGDREFHCQGER
ncbi:MAG: hypothetical protein OEW21_02775 [Betaproteobacteria bacterium]|nr:hypothetical protein [Betaproteobacteria bacterium]